MSLVLAARPQVHARTVPPPQRSRYPDRPPRIRTITFPLPLLRLHTGRLGDDGLRHPWLAHPNRHASYAVRVPRCRVSASGFLPTPPQDDAVASGSELALPLPPEDSHPPPSNRPCRAYHKEEPRSHQDRGSSLCGSAYPTTTGVPASASPCVSCCPRLFCTHNKRRRSVAHVTSPHVLLRARK